MRNWLMLLGGLVSIPVSCWVADMSFATVRGVAGFELVLVGCALIITAITSWVTEADK